MHVGIFIIFGFAVLLMICFHPTNKKDPRHEKLAE